MNKKKLSQTARKIVDTSPDYKALFKQAVQELKELKEENKQLRKQLKAQPRNQRKKRRVKGTNNIAKRNLKKVKRMRSSKRTIKSAAAKANKPKVKLTKEQRFECNRAHNISHFMSRISSQLDIENDLDEELLRGIRKKLNSMDSSLLRIFIRENGFKTTYYCSDASWRPEEVHYWTIGLLYDTVMAY